MSQWAELLYKTSGRNVSPKVDAYKQAFMALHDAPEDENAVRAEKDAWKNLINTLKNADIFGTHAKLKAHWQKEALAARGINVEDTDAPVEAQTRWRARVSEPTETPATDTASLQQAMSGWLR